MNGSSVVSNAQTNRIFSQEAFLHNKAYGTLKDAMVVKNFLFSWTLYDFDNQEFVSLMESWQTHIQKSGWVGYGVFILIGIGIFWGVVKRDKLVVGILMGGVMSLVMIISMNPPFEGIFGWLRENYAIFKEGLRFPFTKFSILFMAGLGVLGGYGWGNLVEIMHKRFWWGLLVSLGSVSLVSAALFWYGLPMFQGQLIHPQMRKKIPVEYFDAFTFMSVQPEGTAVVMPLLSPWGWEYYKWGYQSVGFWWFGIPQQVVVRDFDRWHPQNETFYEQLSRAVYNKRIDDVKLIMTKYATDYVIFDDNLFAPDSTTTNEVSRNVLDRLVETGFLAEIGEFGLIKIYRVKSLPVLTEAQVVDVDSDYNADDYNYQASGLYVSAEMAQTKLPFANLDERSGVTWTFADEGATVHKRVESMLVQRVSASSILSTDTLIPVEIFGRVESPWFEYRLQVREPVLLVNGRDPGKGKSTWLKERIGLVESVGFVSFGNNVVEITSIGNEEIKLGNSIITADTTENILLYSDAGVPFNEVVSVLQSKSPRKCVDPNAQVPLEISGREVKMEASRDSVCWGTQFTVPNRGLLQVKYQAKANQGLYPWLCITEIGGTDGCLNEVLPKTFIREGDWTWYLYQVPVEAGEYYFDFVVQGQETGVKSVAFGEIKLDLYPLVFEQALDLVGEFRSLASDINYEINEPLESLSVTFPVEPIIKENFALSRGVSEANNCALIKSGEAKKQMSFNGVYFEAKNNALSCDYYDYLRLDYKLPVVLRVAGENVQGRGLKGYLFNRTTNRMDDERIFGQGVFDEGMFLYPNNLDGKGYVVNLETRSFGNETAINYLNEVSFWPVSWKWLQQVKLWRKGETLPAKLPVSRLDKSEGVFTVSNWGVIDNGQSYQDGWRVYEVTNRWQRYMPILGKQLDHVKVNGWSNGWVVDSNIDVDVNKDEGFGGLVKAEQKQVVVVFWPQWLEWLGLALLGVSFGGIFFKAVRKVEF